MSESTPPRRSRRLLPVAALLTLAALLAACGASEPTGAASEPTAVTSTEAPAATDAGTDETGTPGESGATPAIASILSTDAISAALGEAPTPDCDTSALTGAGSCVWTATDGSWLKVEDGESRETPDLDAFTQRMTATLGLDRPVEGLGQAAFLGSSSRGTRIAVFLGESRVVWVVLNRQGDASTQATQVTDLMKTVLAGL